MEGNPHQGHRRRMLDKFGRLGVDAFADHELLEVLLYYTIRQGDTNPVAHALMQHFGSLHAVLEATAEQLCEVEGVGPRTAEYLSLISASMRRYQADRIRARNSVVWLKTRIRSERSSFRALPRCIRNRSALPTSTVAAG